MKSTKMQCRYYRNEHIMICCPATRYHMFDELEAEGKSPKEIQYIMCKLFEFDQL